MSRPLLSRVLHPFKDPRFYEWFHRSNPWAAAIRAREEDATFNALDAVIMPNHSVLEIGCGTGNYTVPLAQRCKRVVAIDSSPEMLQYLRQRLSREGLPNVEAQLGRVPEELGTLEKFDGVLSIGVLAYVENLEESLRTLASALKPDGWAIFNVLLASTEGRIYDALTGSIRGRHNILSPTETIDLAEKAGLRVQTATPAGLSEGGYSLVVRAVVPATPPDGSL